MVRKAETNNTLKSAVPLLETSSPTFSEYFSNVQWTNIRWDNILYSTSDFNILDDNGDIRNDGTIIVYTTGLYLVEYDFSLEYLDSTETAEIMTRLELNDGPIDHSWCKFSIYSPNANDKQYLHVHSSKIVRLQVGDTINVAIYSTKDETVLNIVDKSEPTSTDDYGTFRITYIPMGGWNNNTCGSVVNRGIRR